MVIVLIQPDLKSTELGYLRALCGGIYDCAAEYVQLFPRK